MSPIVRNWKVWIAIGACVVGGAGVGILHKPKPPAQPDLAGVPNSTNSGEHEKLDESIIYDGFVVCLDSADKQFFRELVCRAKSGDAGAQIQLLVRVNTQASDIDTKSRLASRVIRAASGHALGPSDEKLCFVALGNCNGIASAMEYLTNYVGDLSKPVDLRDEALVSIGELEAPGDSRVVHPNRYAPTRKTIAVLESYLKSGAVQNRIAAARAIAIGHVLEMKPGLSLQKRVDSDRGVRLAIADSLSNLGG